MGVDIYFSTFTESFNNKIRDNMFIIRGKKEDTKNVIIVDIDEKSLSQLGQWPWSRDKVAKILKNLTLANVKIIGLDIVFAELDQSSPAKVLQDMNLTYKNIPNFDTQLNFMVKNTPTILGYQFELIDQKFMKRDEIDIPAIIVEKNKKIGANFLIKAKGTILNHPNLQDSGYSSGFFNNIPDNSGVIRSVPLVIKYGDQLYPSLALEIVRVYHGVESIYINYSNLGVENIQIDSLKIPTDRHGRFMVNYNGPNHTFKYYSASDIFNNNFNQEEFVDKIVIIGTTASGLNDMRAIPFEPIYPGVEVHANIIDNMISKNFLYIPTWANGANLTLLLSVIILTVILVRFSPLWFNPFIFLLMISSTLYYIYYLLFDYGIVLNSFLPIVAIILSVLIATFIEYLFEIKKEQIIKEKFASKVSKEIMENLIINENNNFSATEKEVTIFFSNLKNFSYISEHIPSAHILIEFLNKYMDPMTEIIIQEKGTVDKFMGDSIMAYWNAPSNLPNHADAALRTALLQLYKVKELNKHLVNNKQFKEVVDICDDIDIDTISINIGLNTGEVIVGEMGSKIRSDYTIIGDAVNIGFKLESLCKYYDSKCNISNFTKWQLKENYIFRFLDIVIVKGQSKPIQIWEVIDFDKNDESNTLYDISREKLDQELDTYHRALDMYQNSYFKEALEIFTEIDNWEYKENSKIYKIYISRCEYYIKNPPKDFDAVFRHTTKE